MKKQNIQMDLLQIMYAKNKSYKTEELTKVLPLIILISWLTFIVKKVKEWKRNIIALYAKVNLKKYPVVVQSVIFAILAKS